LDGAFSSGPTNSIPWHEALEDSRVQRDEHARESTRRWRAPRRPDRPAAPARPRARCGQGCRRRRPRRARTGHHVAGRRRRRCASPTAGGTRRTRARRAPRPGTTPRTRKIRARLPSRLGLRQQPLQRGRRALPLTTRPRRDRAHRRGASPSSLSGSPRCWRRRSPGNRRAGAAGRRRSRASGLPRCS